jgi:hypothetical protein
MPARMKALCLYAGPAALRRIREHGLQPGDIRTVAGAAGGPKGLILGPLDRWLFGHWLARTDQPVDLIGASIGAWRMATACLDENVRAFEQLEHDYIRQDFALATGQARPTPDQVSELFGSNLRAFYGQRVAEVLTHPRYRLHVVTARGRHMLGREHRLRTPIGYLGAFLAKYGAAQGSGGHGWNGWCSRSPVQRCRSSRRTTARARWHWTDPISMPRCRPAARFRS